MAAAMKPLPGRSPPPFDPAMSPSERCQMFIATLPEALREVLASGRVERRSRFCDDDFDDIAETWLPPAGVDAHHAALAHRAIDAIERGVLAPADTNHALARILTLLSHFPAKGLPAQVEEMMALDWAEDLGEFPDWAIDYAARTWRRTRKWRPSIAEMRALCEDACAQERKMITKLKAIARAGAADGAARPASLLQLAGASVCRMP